MLIPWFEPAGYLDLMLSSSEEWRGAEFEVDDATRQAQNSGPRDAAVPVRPLPEVKYDDLWAPS